jgi:predicted porin
VTATFIKYSNTSFFNFVTALYSVFGEDALVNVSVEKKDDNKGKLAGYIRIRSKTQGIALSLGDRITSIQRGLPESNSTKQ